jgi:predicted nucleotidyltransferase component of viral defense system
MTKKRIQDVPASVKQRLLNLARKSSQEFNLILIRYGIERFLYRLSQSEHADDFVLKGAILFHPWGKAPHRPTRDVDLLGRGSPDLTRMAQVIRDICRLKVKDDGLVFDESSVRTERIRDEEEYLGIRAYLEGHLGTARIQLQIDVGFGDTITPKPRKQALPCLLDSPPPRLRVYPWETVVAEKYQALVELGMTNSRTKDFFDLRYMAREFEFTGGVLSQAIRATFKRRNTDLPQTLPVALSPKFTEDPTVRTRWAAFLRRSRPAKSDLELRLVAEEIWAFLRPVTESLLREAAFEKRWEPGGPWV